MSRLVIARVSVFALACLACMPGRAHAASNDFRPAPSSPRTGILTPAQRVRAMEIYEAVKDNPRARRMFPQTGQPDDVDLIIAGMCHALYDPCDDDPAAANRTRILYCSTRDTYPGTGDPEPFVSLLFSGPRLWVLGVSAVVLVLEVLARLAVLTGAGASAVRLTNRAA